MSIMHDVNLASVDLNLLVALDALLEERHVTRAARRLGLSQPAASHALGRLRDLLGDPLLVRAGSTLVPTPRAAAVARDLRTILDSIRATLAGGTFDPVTSERRFAFAAADYFELVVLPPLVGALATSAPHVDLVVRPHPEDAATALGEGKLDVVFGVEMLPGAGNIRRRNLFQDGYVCAVRAGHPVLRRGLDLERFLQLGHVFIAPRGTRGGVVDDALARRKKVRRVVAMVPSFLAAPAVVASSDLIVTMPVRAARRLAPAFDLRLLEPPLPLPRFTVAAYWHDRVHDDPAHVWLREQLLAVTSSIGE